TDPETGLRVHNNTAESVNAGLKASIRSVFHHVSPKHLSRYLIEIAYRWNRRRVGARERLLGLLAGMAASLSRSRSAYGEEVSEERDLPVGPLPARHEPGQGGTGSGSSPGLAEGCGSREPLSVAPLLRGRKLRDFGSCPLRSSGHGVSAPDDPRPGGGTAGGPDPESPEGFHPTGSSIEPRRGSTPPAAHREPVESLVLEEPGPDERRHTGAGRGQSACPQDHAPRHGPAP